MSYSTTVNEMWVNSASNSNTYSSSKDPQSSKEATTCTTGSPVTKINTVPSITGNFVTHNHKKGQDDFKRFYIDNGCENHARKAGLIDNNGDISPYSNRRVGNTDVALAFDNKPQLLSPQVSPFKLAVATTPTRVDVAQSPTLILPVSSDKPHGVTYLPTSPATPKTPINSSNTPVTSGIKRKRSYDYDYGDSDKKRSLAKRAPSTSRSGNDKGSKGLRHFSMKVCEKVQQKGTTTYNEVADELVREFSSDQERGGSTSDQTYDQKNIRRRVYDALNVLMAMNIISKEKKEIKWIGLPTNSAQELVTLEKEVSMVQNRVQEKKERLREYIIQLYAYKNLVKRNRHTENESTLMSKNSCIHLPFVIINTSNQTFIDCSISNDKFEYLLNFDNTFEIHNDIEVLKRMGVVSKDVLNSQEKVQVKELEEIKSIVPKVVGDTVLDVFYKDNANALDSSVSSKDAPSTSKSTPPSSPLAVPIDNLNDFTVISTPDKQRNTSRAEAENFQCSSLSNSRSSSPCSSTSRSSTPNFSNRKY